MSERRVALRATESAGTDVGGWVENGAPVGVFAVSYDAMPLPDVQIWARPLEAHESLTVHHAYGVIGQWLIHT